jgi:hypothetical protein
VGLPIIVCSFHALTLYSSRHIVMLPELVIPLTDILFLSIVFFLMVPSLLERLKSRQQFLIQVETELRVMALVTAEIT